MDIQGKAKQRKAPQSTAKQSSGQELWLGVGLGLVAGICGLGLWLGGLVTKWLRGWFSGWVGHWSSGSAAGLVDRLLGVFVAGRVGSWFDG